MSENLPIQNIDSSGLVIITVDTTGSIMLTLKASMQLNFNSDPWPAKMQKSNILDTHRAAVQTQTLQYRTSCCVQYEVRLSCNLTLHSCTSPAPWCCTNTLQKYFPAIK